MNAQTLDDLLLDSIDDRRVSRAERKALRYWLAERSPTEQDLARFRTTAFDIARKHLRTAADNEIVDWLEDVVRLLTPILEKRPSRVTGAHFSPGDDCQRRICELIATAKTSIDVCVFTITDDRIADALLVAFARGIAVRVVTDDEKAHDLGSDIERVRSAGIPIRSDHSEAHMHHKFAIFDRAIFLTGSYNWTRSAATNNLENIVVSGNRKLVDSFLNTFDFLWERLGREGGA